MHSIVDKIKKHFADLNYKIDITGTDAKGIDQKFSHNIIFLDGQCSIRLFRLIQKYFGDPISVVGTNKTRVMLFNFNPDGHESITGICKLCGCGDSTSCTGEGNCYWTEQDLCDGCHEQKTIIVPAAPPKKVSNTKSVPA